MKKPYVKPGMYVENFSLAQSIAAGCGVEEGSSFGSPLLRDKATCAWGDAQIAVWTSSVETCTIKWGEDDPFEGVCYNNPNGGASIFSYS